MSPGHLVSCLTYSGYKLAAVSDITAVDKGTWGCSMTVDNGTAAVSE